MRNDSDISLNEMMVLDIGAGDGESSVLLNKKGSFVISLDYDLKMLKKGLRKSKITKGQAVLADAKYLPFKDDYFDLVYSRYVLHWQNGRRIDGAPS